MNPNYPIKNYDVTKAIHYAHTYSMSRNPKYLDFSNLGGDCTNFISQCLYAGSGVSNDTPVYGWYYINAYNRSASWSGARFLYKFLTKNEGIGPFAIEVTLPEILPGDVIQFAKNNGLIYHSLIVVEIGHPITADNVLVSTHTVDVDYMPLSSYDYEVAHFLHIEGIRI